MEHIANIVEILKPILPILIKTLMELILKRGGVTPKEQLIMDIINKLLELGEVA